jgi:hypothetical protein
MMRCHYQLSLDKGAVFSPTAPIPAALLQWLAPLLLALAFMMPWWNISMVAPQYPQGLHVTTWFFAVTGDVSEVDELNHYIGFMPLASVAHLERVAASVIGPLTLLLLAFAVGCKHRFARFAALPAIMLPLIFVGDLAAWLYFAGHHLDQHAALSTSVAPWTPKLLGLGGVGQFHTLSQFGAGFYLALAAAIITVVTLRQRPLNSR